MSTIRSNPSCAVARMLSVFTLFSISCHALAQTAADDDTMLPPVVVTASRIEQPQTDALPHTTVITAEDIRNSQAVDVPSLLKHEAGIQFTQSGGYGEASGLFMRGAETRQTLILLDGIPLTKQDATGTVSIEHLMLDQIDHIEIVRGNVSSIYGSGAVGGVIQIFTKRGSGAPQPSVKLEAGSRDTTRLQAGVSGSSGGTRYSFSASDFKTKGFSALNPDQIPSANPDRDGYHNTSASGSLSQEVAKGHELGVLFSSATGKFDFDSSFSAPTDAQAGKTNVDTVSVYSQNHLTDNWKSRLSYSESRDKNANRYESTFAGVTSVTNDSYQTKTGVLQWNNEYAISGPWIANAGFERQWQSITSDDGYGDVYAANRNANSFYAGLQGKIGLHQLQLNARHDQIDQLESANTGYLGYGYSLTEKWKAIASLSTGFSAPPLGYLYAPFFGNPGLKPEHTYSKELGLQYAYGSALFRTTAFETRTTQQFIYDPVSNKFDNIARASNKGIEFSANGSCRGTDLRGSLTLQNPRDDTSGDRVRRRAQTLASISASRLINNWSVEGDVDYTGDRPDGAQYLGGYWVANANLRYNVTKSTALYGRIENLFNRNYQTAYGYNQPPRGVFVGLNWQP